MAIDSKACGIKALFLSNVAAASLAHAQRVVALSAVVTDGNRENLAEARQICEEMERQYQTAWNALKAHQKQHRC